MRNKRGTNAPLQPDAVPNVAQVAVLTRLAGRPHGSTAGGVHTRPDMLWRMERAGWVATAGVVKVTGVGMRHVWRITSGGRAALERTPVKVIIWRAVVASQQRSGRGSVLGPDTTRRARWWSLTLECEHVVERTVRYKSSDTPQRGGTQHRYADDVLPAPVRVQCEYCKAAALRAARELETAAKLGYNRRESERPDRNGEHQA